MFLCMPCQSQPVISDMYYLFYPVQNHHARFALYVHAFETGETVHKISLQFHQKGILKFLVLISFHHYNLILCS